MKRFCIIGNSHLAAWKLGWDSLRSATTGVALTFFGASGTAIRRLAVQDCCLVPLQEDLRKSLQFTSGGKEKIDPKEFDSFCVIGSAFGIGQLARLYKTCRAESHKPGKRSQLLSDDCFSEAARGLLASTFGFRTALTLTEVTGGPIHLVPDPFPSSAVLNDQTQKLWTGLVSSGDHAKLALEFRCAAEDLSTDRIRVLAQPPQLVCNEMFTPEEYSRGSVQLSPGLDRPNSAQDYLHMNKRFGELIIADLLNRLE